MIGHPSSISTIIPKKTKSGESRTIKTGAPMRSIQPFNKRGIASPFAGCAGAFSATFLRKLSGPLSTGPASNAVPSSRRSTRALPIPFLGIPVHNINELQLHDKVPTSSLQRSSKRNASPAPLPVLPGPHEATDYLLELELRLLSNPGSLDQS